MALARRGVPAQAQRLQLDGDRSAVRAATVRAALAALTGACEPAVAGGDA
jgi:nicotinamide mononucleotide (NMN) deamidase PncC